MTPLFAQRPSGGQQAEMLQLQQYQRTKDLGNPAENERRRQAEWIQSDLVRKANKFALLWAQFSAQANTGHTFGAELCPDTSGLDPVADRKAIGERLLNSRVGALLAYLKTL